MKMPFFPLQPFLVDGDDIEAFRATLIGQERQLFLSGAKNYVSKKVLSDVESANRSR